MNERKQKQLLKLGEIASLTGDYICGERSTTPSVLVEEWCDIHCDAVTLVQLVGMDYFDSFLDRWIAETLSKLRNQERV